MRRTLRVWLTVAVLLMMVGPATQTQGSLAADTCEQLVAQRAPDATIREAVLVSGGAFTPPQASTALTGLPDFCRVSAVVPPAINIEVWLPVESWNGRFQGVGGGGLAGVISYGALANAVREGYASASTDTGHVGGFDAAWAIGHPELLADFGYRAVHEMTRVGKTVTEAFYATPPHHAYWVGCSTGGRQGLMEVQRYPTDYDGALIGAPAIDWSALHVAQLWDARTTLTDPDAYLSPAQLVAVHEAVLARWDAADGAADGVIGDPTVVQLDLSALQRAAGLSTARVEALRKLYQGPVDGAGQPVYPGLMPGGEALWPIVTAGPAPFGIGEAVYRDMVKQDPMWDWTSLDIDADLPAARVLFGDVLDTLDPDLTAFKEHGGKLIVYHGFSDPLIAPERTRQYFLSVIDTLGGRDAVDAFARLYLLGGVGHCRGGAGADTFDGLGALVQWVEGGVPPTRMVATHLTDGRVDRARPLCAFPRQAHYGGAGNVADATSWSCV